MARFEVQGPDGATYEIEAPNEDAARKAFSGGKVSGSFLPFSRDAAGNIAFDSDAGIVGTIKRAVTAPGDVYTGKLDPYSDEAKRRAFDLAALISPVNPGVRAGDKAIPGALMATKPGKPKVPTAGELKAATDTGYKAVRATGAEYPGRAVASLADDVTRLLEEKGFLAETAPKTFSILKRLGKEPGEPSVVTISSLDAARKAFNKVVGDSTDMEAARRVIERLDDFIQAGGQAGAVAGAPSSTGAGAANLPRIGGTVAPDPQAEAARLIRDARGNAAARFRSDRITGVEDAAGLRTSAANSGQNLGNTLRQRLASLLLDPKKTRGFSKGELDAIRKVVEGTATADTLRYVSNLLGGGGGIGQALVSGGAGSLVGDPTMGALTGLAVYGTGRGTRAGYNALTARQVGLLDELIRKRSPLYQQRAANPPMVVISPARRSVPVRGLLETLGDEPN